MSSFVCHLSCPALYSVQDSRPVYSRRHADSGATMRAATEPDTVHAVISASRALLELQTLQRPDTHESHYLQSQPSTIVLVSPSPLWLWRPVFHERPVWAKTLEFLACQCAPFGLLELCGTLFRLGLKAALRLASSWGNLAPDRCATGNSSEEPI